MKFMSEVLIGKGRTGKVYRISDDLVRKEFSPTYFVRSWHGFFYKPPHPLDTKTGHLNAYWKRKLVHRVAMYIDPHVHVVDALDTAHNGFTSLFIDGRAPSEDEMQETYAKAQGLEQTFDAIGMPAQSFRRNYLISRRKNFIIRDGQVFIPDYEQSVPLPDVRGNFGYDVVYFDDVHRFISDSRLRITDTLGAEETSNLDEAFEWAKFYQGQLDIRPRIMTKFGGKFSKPLSRREIDKAVEKLYDEGKITAEEVEEYRSGKTGENIRLAVTNLGVHSAIGLLTPPYIASLHSAAGRLAWTLANWGYYLVKGDSNRRKLHGWRVMLVSALPLPLPFSVISNGAYLISIMEENPMIGLAIEDNLFREFAERGLEETLKTVGSKPVVKPLVKAYEAISHKPPIEWLQEKALGRNTKRAHDILLSYLMDGARR